MDEQQEFFVNRHEAVKHLKAQGFKISKTKVYQDSRAGRLRIQANGTVLMEDLAAYKNSLFQPSTWGGADDWREILFDVRRSLKRLIRLLDVVLAMRSKTE